MADPGRDEIIFLEALEQAPDGRAAFLDEACGPDPTLRARVERLLDAVAVADRWIETLAQKIAGPAEALLAEGATSAAASAAISLPGGTRLGPWRLVAAVGSGGMGTVYRAERADGAFEMPAAVKVIRTDRPRLGERLVRERQLLARLDHPGIARLLDGGMTDQGLAYLVMEWVPGRDLADLDRRSDTCLPLFLQITAAVTHAHQRMVVHGDIKPANVRVMPDGRARLLDFGIARLLTGAGEAREDMRAMTPAFAAPEQVAGQPTTTQTDIWALGALLHWMVTGAAPARNRPVTADALDRPRSRDLAAILNRAMAERPADRYATVAALAEDVERLRDHEPVRAAPTAWPRRLVLWGRRHRLAAALGALALASGLLGAAAVAWQVRVALAERDVARFEYERFYVVRDRLVELFAEGADERGDGTAPSARELLDRAAARAGDQADDAEWLALLGDIYLALDDYPAARPPLETVVASGEGAVSPMARGRALTALAAVQHREGDTEGALASADAALRLFSDLPGDLRLRRSEAHQVRGRVFRSLGRWEEAIAELETGLQLARNIGRPTRLLASAENNLAVTFVYAGRTDAARPHFEGALGVFQELGAGNSSEALIIMGNLANVLFRLGRLDEAEPLFVEAIARRRARFGESAPLGALYVSHGRLLAIRHRLDDAREHLDAGAALLARFAGPASPDYALALRAVAYLDTVEGDFTSADARLAEAAGILERALGPEHPFTLIGRVEQAVLLRHLDRDAAVQALIEAIDALEAAGPAAEVELATALCEQAMLHVDRGEPATALEPATRCHDMRRASLPAEAWQRVEAETLLARIQTELGEEAAAARVQAGVTKLAESYGVGHPRLRWFERLDRR